MKTNANKTEQVNNETVVVELTSRENKMINALVSLLYAEPGFSDIEVADLAKATKMKQEEVKGLIVSLTKKELVFTADAHEHVGGTKGLDLIYLAPIAWSLHPSWKEESEFELEIKINDSNVAKPATSKVKLPAKPKATTAKNVVKPKSTTKSLNDTKAKEEELADNNTNRPYSVYGLHGANNDLKGFKKGDPILFTIKGRGEVTGEYTHLHTNNWSPKGYVVIKFEGKIYERVPSKVSKPVTENKVVVKKVTPAEKKIDTAKKPAVTAKKAK
jgi:hypothetical protein